jgi:hypothetical protein
MSVDDDHPARTDQREGRLALGDDVAPAHGRGERLRAVDERGCFYDGVTR